MVQLLHHRRELLLQVLHRLDVHRRSRVGAAARAGTSAAAGRCRNCGRILLESRVAGGEFAGHPQAGFEASFFNWGKPGSIDREISEGKERQISSVPIRRATRAARPRRTSPRADARADAGRSTHRNSRDARARRARQGDGSDLAPRAYRPSRGSRARRVTRTVMSSLTSQLLAKTPGAKTPGVRRTRCARAMSMFPRQISRPSSRLPSLAPRVPSPRSVPSTPL